MVKEKIIKKVNLNLGCGKKHIKDFINIDIDPQAKPDIVRNIEKGLPFNDDSVNNIYTAHFMEHVSPDNINFVMFEIWRVLKDKGQFKCIVPINSSLMGSPYHKSFWNEFTPMFFTNYNNKEETGFEFKLIHSEKPAQKESYNEQFMFVLEVIKSKLKPKVKYNKIYLNLGSGNRKRPVEEGWINIDIDPTSNPDIVRNTDKGLPFDTNSVDGVYASHVIEHIDDIYYFMYEIWRVCKPDSKVEIIAPNHAHLMSIYPNHKRFIRPQYFDSWTPKELYLNSVMNYESETGGAEFVSLNESIVENSGAIRFYLQVIKKESKIKKDLKKQLEDFNNKEKEK